MGWSSPADCNDRYRAYFYLSRDNQGHRDGKPAEFERLGRLAAAW